MEVTSDYFSKLQQKYDFSSENLIDEFIKQNPDYFKKFYMQQQNWKLRNFQQNFIENGLTNHNGIINLNDTPHIISKRLSKGDGVIHWGILPNLQTFLIKRTLKERIKYDVDYNKGFHFEDKQLDIATYNHLVLPKISEQAGMPSAQYLLAEYNDEQCLMTPDFLRDGEEFISASEFWRGYVIQASLEDYQTYLSKQKVPQQDIEEIKLLYLQQTIFNKFIEQQDDTSENSGLIKKSDKIKFSYNYDYDFCSGVKKPLGYGFNFTRILRDAPDSSMFSVIQKYKRYNGIQSFLKSFIEKFDINKVVNHLNIPEEYKAYYINYYSERLSELRRIYNICYDNIIEDNRIR